MEQSLEQLKYPIGQFDRNQQIDEDRQGKYILSISMLPSRLHEEVADLTPDQLDTPYRDGGWTVRQVVHHLPDSHLNGYTRLKLALTEENPTICPYDEKAWANLNDSLHGDPAVSLALLEALHKRWVLLLLSLTPEQMSRTFVHPVSGEHTLRQHLGMYAWHGEHHLAHITGLKKRMGW